MGERKVSGADGSVDGCCISQLLFKSMRVNQHWFPPVAWLQTAAIIRTAIETCVKSEVLRDTMPTPRETILAALHARLSALPAAALRGEVLPERVPAEGLLILRDGEPGEPEVTLSPLAYHYQHRAEIEAVVQGAERDTTFDALTASIGAALAADRTLGGLCDWVEAEAPRPVDLPVEGAASLKAAVIPVVLYYTAADPLA